MRDTTSDTDVPVPSMAGKNLKTTKEKGRWQ